MHGCCILNWIERDNNMPEKPFKSTLAYLRGLNGEEAFEWLCDNEFILGYNEFQYYDNYENVSQITAYQEREIDFVVQFCPRDGEPYKRTFEVKNDGKVRTGWWGKGNIVFEIKSNIELNRDGWGITSEADYLAYLNWKAKEMYIVNFDALKNLVKTNFAKPNKKEHYHTVEQKEPSDSSKKKRSLNALIPIKDIESLGSPNYYLYTFPTFYQYHKARVSIRTKMTASLTKIRNGQIIPPKDDTPV